MEEVVGITFKDNGKVYYFLPGITNSKYNILTNKELLTGYEDYKQKFNKLLTTFFDNMR